jgi:spore maturation protein CgeB
MPLRSVLPIAHTKEDYESLRVLVIKENWLGNTGLSAFNAFLRLGTWASAISETDYIPREWKSLTAKLFARLIRTELVREFNRALLDEATVIRPHLFFAVKGTFLLPETIKTLRQNGTAAYCFYPDVSFLVHGKYLPLALPEYDWIFTTKSFGPQDLKQKLGITRSSFLPHAYDPQVHVPRKPTPELLQFLGADVSFVGAWSPKKQRLLEALVKQRPQVKLRVWGNSWNRLSPESVLRRFVEFKPIYGLGYASVISCSKINLGLLHEQVHGASSGDLITSRTFHIPACGGLLLHERTSDVLKIFKDGESCVCFDGPDELIAKVDELLADKPRRKAIADSGRRVVASAHSWDHRARAVLDHFLGRQSSEGHLESA